MIATDDAEPTSQFTTRTQPHKLSCFVTYRFYDNEKVSFFIRDSLSRNYILCYKSGLHLSYHYSRCGS